MKKRIFSILLAAVILTASAVIAFANSGIRVMLDGEFVEVEAVIVNERTLLPARAMVETLGGEVDWNGETRQVTLVHGDTVILLTIDDPVAMVNGSAVELDVPAQIIDGSTMLPLRFVGQSLGLEIHWFDEVSPPVVIVMTENAALTVLDSKDIIRAERHNLH